MPQRILVHDFCGHPFQVQLSRELARRGHEVTHAYCSSYVTGRGRLAVEEDDPSTFDVRAISMGRDFDKHSVLGRLRQEFTYGRALAAATRSLRPEVVLSANTPLVSQALFQRAAHRIGASFVFWLQDLISEGAAAFADGRLVGGAARLATKTVAALEGRLLRRSDGVIPISNIFLDNLEAWGVNTNKVDVIENWAPIDEVAPVEDRNKWAEAQGLAGRDLVVYAGTLGLKHPYELLYHLARGLDPPAMVVVVSEGEPADRLKAMGDAESLETLCVLPFQPYEELPAVLAAAEALLVLLSEDAGSFSIPSKVLTNLSSGRPTLAVIPAANPATRVIEEAGAGLVIDSTEERATLPGALVRSARRLLDDPHLRDSMGSAARTYARTKFDIREIGDSFEAVLTKDVLSREGNEEVLRLGGDPRTGAWPTSSPRHSSTEPAAATRTDSRPQR